MKKSCQRQKLFSNKRKKEKEGKKTSYVDFLIIFFIEVIFPLKSWIVNKMQLEAQLEKEKRYMRI